MFHKKCQGCFLVYLFLKGFFLLKVQKECAYVIMLKIALLFVKIYVLVGKRDKRISVLGSPKTYC